ncbi:hypothetical protein A6F68_01666 [Tsuneonella dongtanensis]|uniref:Uncharacterized protein n=1 Tax=Tsuneonella dongtanensis TaxID=692370 RepID=A0A1B2ADE9_9SPHN|nr:hypothetical protein [Tsuneonella dongtanensis]ANY20179.1 hypothetical protein A6F68_01666 [Tsuneonella dongtanensis]
MSHSPAHRVRRKPGFFHPVPVRARCDGWSIVRQCHFLAYLYLTGSVTAAARGVGMSPKSAYRLRARDGAEGFAYEWDRVLTHPGTGRPTPPPIDYRKVTNPTLRHRVEIGRVKPVLHMGQVVGIARKADNTTLLRALRRHDAVCASIDRDEREEDRRVFANTRFGVTGPIDERRLPLADAPLGCRFQSQGDPR